MTPRPAPQRQRSAQPSTVADEAEAAQLRSAVYETLVTVRAIAAQASQILSGLETIHFDLRELSAALRANTDLLAQIFETNHDADPSPPGF